MKVSDKLPIGTKVVFGKDWLEKMGGDTLRRYKGREGVIAGYRGQTGPDVPEPIVDFPKHGRLKSERLFEVQWSRLELADQQ